MCDIFPEKTPFSFILDNPHDILYVSVVFRVTGYLVNSSSGANSSVFSGLGRVKGQNFTLTLRN